MCVCVVHGFNKVRSLQMHDFKQERETARQPFCPKKLLFQWCVLETLPSFCFHFLSSVSPSLQLALSFIPHLCFHLPLPLSLLLGLSVFIPYRHYHHMSLSFTFFYLFPSLSLFHTLCLSLFLSYSFVDSEQQTASCFDSISLVYQKPARTAIEIQQSDWRAPDCSFLRKRENRMLLKFMYLISLFFFFPPAK